MCPVSYGFQRSAQGLWLTTQTADVQRDGQRDAFEAAVVPGLSVKARSPWPGDASCAWACKGFIQPGPASNPKLSSPGLGARRLTAVRPTSKPSAFDRQHAAWRRRAPHQVLVQAPAKRGRAFRWLGDRWRARHGLAIRSGSGAPWRTTGGGIDDQATQGRSRGRPHAPPIRCGYA